MCSIDWRSSPTKFSGIGSPRHVRRYLVLALITTLALVRIQATSLLILNERTTIILGVQTATIDCRWTACSHFGRMLNRSPLESTILILSPPLSLIQVATHFPHSHRSIGTHANYLLPTFDPCNSIDPVFVRVRSLDPHAWTS